VIEFTKFSSSHSLSADPPTECGRLTDVSQSGEVGVIQDVAASL
jgi:hypothetical protein